MKKAIKLGKGYLPQEVKAAANRINNALSEYEGEFQIDPFDKDMDWIYVSRPSKYSTEKAYMIAENHEGGAIHLGDCAEGGLIDGVMACNYDADDPQEKIYTLGVHNDLRKALGRIGFFAECYDPGTYIAYRL